VARALFAALEAERWSDAASFISPRMAMDHKRVVVDFAIEEEAQRAGIVVQNEHASRIQRLLETAWYCRRYGVTSVDDLLELSAVELLARTAAVESPNGPYAGPSAVAPTTAARNAIVRVILRHTVDEAGMAQVFYSQWRMNDGTETQDERQIALVRQADQWYANDLHCMLNFWHPYPPS
jgi:hypothetical protein